MNEHVSLGVLLATAISIGFFHTLIGVDHTLPFVVLGKSRGWSLRKVLGITALCGVGHVASSVLLGYVGIGVGVALSRLEWIEASRGDLAAWLLLGFGLLLTVRAVWRSLRGRRHEHAHAHSDGSVHRHPHDHVQVAHRHPHAGAAPKVVWSLFLIFVFGPCEPLIPLLMAPAALHGWTWVALVSGTFGAVTVATMLAVVAAAHLGLGRLPLGRLERHMDALAGSAIMASGAAIKFLGL